MVSSAPISEVDSLAAAQTEDKRKKTGIQAKPITNILSANWLLTN